MDFLGERNRSASAVREPTPVFRNIAWRWVRTVCREMPRRCAISLLARPRATRAATCSSVRVRLPGSGRGECRDVSLRARLALRGRFPVGALRPFMSPPKWSPDGTYESFLGHLLDTPRMPAHPFPGMRGPACPTRRGYPVPATSAVVQTADLRGDATCCRCGSLARVTREGKKATGDFTTTRRFEPTSAIARSDA